MKRADLITFYKRLPLLKDLKGVKLAYSIIKNSKKLEEEVKTYQEISKPSEKFSEFEKKRIELCNKYCEKDKDGNPIQNNGMYQGLENHKQFFVEYEKLKKEYFDVIKEREEQVKKMNEFLSEEIEFDFYKVKLEDVPNDVSVEQMAIIDIFLQGGEGE